MNSFFSLAKTLFKAAIFFTLFAFALNNQADVTVHFFFGYQWTSPLVMVVLISFAGGLLLGILGMVPRWWQQRREAKRNSKLAQAPIAQAMPAADDTLTHGL
jgi:lipopolysaccharide assembly protein A